MAVKTIRNGLRPATLTQWATLGDAKSERPATITQLRFALASLRASGDLDPDPKRAALLKQGT
ncbi:hypothetical protein [Nostoc sp. ChiVER01]|uniref:hypothetical protein n=1 Tax=Nostoc sp. ChiVER01 TaxID=3075382 RepID=UPI002AD4EB95|nr:hypothetical protein [Nostoc sp. ChiVER01]MDZ8221824.1 hypothetical protein [Nostoc sp. ChiVER01]